MSHVLLALLFACGGAEAPAPEPTPAPAPVEAPAPPPPAEPAAAPAEETRLNVNTASEDEFKAKIDGLGEKMAHEFEEYRPYKSITQFRKEMGKYVKADKIAEYEKHIFVPIAFDSCDAATLAQIHGLDEAAAKDLIDARPFETADAFIAKLEAGIGKDKAEAARPLLAE